MQNNIRIEVKQEDLDRITQRYGEELIKKSSTVVLNYTEKVSDEARTILEKEKKRDTGRLIRSIKPSLRIYAKGIIKGEVKAGAKHARFVHEGVKHKNGTLRRYFVPFKVAPSLLKWAKRKNIIFKLNGYWHYADSKGNYVAINNIQNSGLMVYQRPTKFFTKPFEESIKQDFINDMGKVIKEV